MIRAFGMCFDRRVLLALGAAGIGLWIAAPQVLAAAFPLLLLLACPLSMLFMMRGTGHAGAHGGGNATAATPQERVAALELERARIDAEIARAGAESAAPAPLPDQHAG